MTEPVVITESLGGSALSRAARAGQLPEWYRPTPRGSEWSAYADEVRQSVSTNWFEQLSPAFSASGAAAERLKRSAGGKGIVVTTGQQPGLFGGALMTFVKALAARGLADVLQETLGIPVAPVFWAATDDADFDEAAVVSVALDGGARELCLEQRTPAGTPMARVPLAGRELESLTASLIDACGSAPHRSYLEAALSAYRDGATVGDAYVALLRHVLEPLEIAVIDASHPAVMSAGSPLLRRAAQASETVATALDRRADEMRARSFEPQVEKVAGLSLVFSNTSRTKRRLTLSEAAALDATSSPRLSSTVLLRPVLERSILPTAAYLGGPGEVAYFGQVTAVASALGAPIPLVLPRWSSTILEPRIQRMLDALGAEPSALADPHALESRLARERMPDDVASALAATRRALAAQTDALRKTAEGLVPDRAVEGLRRSIDHHVDRMERRLLAGVKRRESDLMRTLATVRGSLYPHGIRQERKLSFIPLLARYGPPLVDQMLDAARAHARTLVAGTPSLTPPSAAAPAPV
jgi:uncharacterized protein YllA (UPF0747 family)